MPEKRYDLWKKSGEIASLYVNDHLSTVEIANRYNAGVTTITKILISEGVKIRDLSSAKLLIVDDMGTRFWSKVRKTDYCWVWVGATDSDGYGKFEPNGRYGSKVMAHRISWEIHNGSVPDNILVCHKCDNPPCVNPSHLFLGTELDNAQDKVHKGRQPRGEQIPWSELTEAKVLEIRSKYLLGNTSYKKLASEYDVTASAIQGIIERRTWKWLL